MNVSPCKCGLLLFSRESAFHKVSVRETVNRSISFRFLRSRIYYERYLIDYLSLCLQIKKERDHVLEHEFSVNVHEVERDIFADKFVI